MPMVSGQQEVTCNKAGKIRSGLAAKLVHWLSWVSRGPFMGLDFGLAAKLVSWLYGVSRGPFIGLDFVLAAKLVNWLYAVSRRPFMRIDFGLSAKLVNWFYGVSHGPFMGRAKLAPRVGWGESVNEIVWLEKNMLSVFNKSSEIFGTIVLCFNENLVGFVK